MIFAPRVSCRPACSTKRPSPNPYARQHDRRDIIRGHRSYAGVPRHYFPRVPRHCSRDGAAPSMRRPLKARSMSKGAGGRARWPHRSTRTEHLPRPAGTTPGVATPQQDEAARGPSGETARRPTRAATPDTAQPPPAPTGRAATPADAAGPAQRTCRDQTTGLAPAQRQAQHQGAEPVCRRPAPSA
jgi:hypothetical protein